jgi:hypothetical protein
VKKKWLVAPIALLALSCLPAWDSCGFWPMASVSGNLVARWDTGHHRYKVIGYGMPTPWRQEEKSALMQRYGIEFRPGERCIVPEWFRQFADAYDNFSEERIRAKFGRNVVRETAEEAFQNWQHAHADALK